MDKMTLFAILTVSVPEAFFNIFLGFVFIGRRGLLRLNDRLNLKRMLMSVALMVTVAVTGRAMLPNMVFVIISNLVLYTIILKFVYFKVIKWSEAIACTLIFMSFLATIEFTYLYQFVTFYSKSLINYHSNDMVRLVSSIPERAAQIFVIISFWEWDFVLYSIGKNKRALRTFLILAILLLISEAIFTFSFVCNLEKFSQGFKIAYSLGCMLIGVVNFLIGRFVILICERVRR